MFKIHFEVDNKLDNLDEKIKAAVAKKLIELVDVAYGKVYENLSGKVLQKKSGQLLGSLRRSVSLNNNENVGQIFLDDDTPKALALEKGGERYYPIVATKASILSFISKSGERVFAHSVNHPPSKAFGYFRLAGEEMVDLVPAGFKEAIDEAISGRE
jgi:hypothetical protein